MAQPGDVIGGRYRLEKILGEGGMGTVFIAEHNLLGKKVAVKVLHQEYTGHTESIARFYREAQAAAAVGHKGIVEIHDVGWMPSGYPYMVMELLRGEPLDGLFRRSGVLDEATVIDIAVQMLSALIAVHRLQIVHRDLKPGNIFVTYDADGTSQVKILDFGISKVADQDDSSPKLTQTGTVMGTPYYMAPEQARGEGDVDHRADLWSLGAIMYQGLTGKVPFDGTNARQVLSKILTEPVNPPHLYQPELSEDLEAVVLRALEKDREQRYRRAQDFLSDLLVLRDEKTEVSVKMPTPMNWRSGIDQERPSRQEARAQINHESLTTAETLPRSDQTAGRDVAVPGPESDAHSLRRPVAPGAGSSEGQPAAHDLKQADHRLLRSDWTTMIMAWAKRLTPWTERQVEPATELRTSKRTTDRGSDTLTASVTTLPVLGWGRRRLALAAGAAIALLVAAVVIAAIWWPTRIQTGESAPVANLASPTSGEARADGGSIEGAVISGSDGAADPSPDESHPPAKQSPMKTSPRSKAGPSEGRSPAPREDASKERPSTGKLYLDTRPWTNVSLGGRELGPTPLVGIDLPLGRHNLRLVDAQGTVYRRDVAIEPGQPTRLFVDLSRPTSPRRGTPRPAKGNNSKLRDNPFE